MGDIRNNKLFISIIRAVFLTWIIVVAVLSLISFPEGNVTSDKWLINSSRAEVHAAAYFIGALLCFYSFRLEGIGFVILAGIGVFLFGVIFEIVQIWLPYRAF